MPINLRRAIAIDDDYPMQAADGDEGGDEERAFRRGLLAGSQRPLTARTQRRLRRLVARESQLGALLVDGDADFRQLDLQLASVENAISAVLRPYLRCGGNGE